MSIDVVLAAGVGVGMAGAMDTMYQRGNIKEESMYYEHRKYDGSLSLVGVNAFLPKEHAGDIVTEIELIRSTPEEKGQQIDNVATYQQLRNELLPASGPLSRLRERAGVRAHDTSDASEPTGEAKPGLTYLQKTARDRKNVFAALMEG